MFGLALPDFNGLVFSIGTGIGLTFPSIDTDYLTTMGEAYAAESGRAGGYRMAIKGDQPMVFAALMNYVGKTLKIPANQVAFSRSSSAIRSAWAMAMRSARSSLPRRAVTRFQLRTHPSLSANPSQNLGIKSNNEGIGGFFAKVMAFFNRIARAIVDLFKGFGSKAVA